MENFQYTPPKNAIKTDEELIADLQSVAKMLKTDKLSMLTYTKHGKYDCGTIARSFDTWNQALIKAGLQLSNINNYSDEKLFENILNIWQLKGTQPTRRDLNTSMSEISTSPYSRRFNSWSAAIREFIAYANSLDILAIKDEKVQTVSNKISRREPSLRLRFKVLQRDYFTCVQCGASPSKDQTTKLHVDHIKPWSNGGQTEFSNLQTLCAKCNLGKSNLE